MTYHVYRYWSGSTALYIGRTSQIQQRLFNHRRKAYAFEADRIDACEVVELADAVAIERSQITEHQPIYNCQHNPRNGGLPAPKVKTPQSFYNWKAKGFEGFYPAEPIEEPDTDKEQSE